MATRAKTTKTATTTRKRTTKKVTPEVIDLTLLNGLIADIQVAADDEEYYDVAVKLDGDYVYITHDYDEESYDSFEAVVVRLRAILEEVKANAGIEVQVGTYTGKVTPDGITVGCQNVSFEQFDELAKVVTKIRSIN